MRSAAAMVVQAGGPPAVARWTVAATLGAGAALDWQPQPIVVCDGAELHSQMTVTLQRGAHAVLREEVVLGRAGQRGGRFVGELTVDLGGGGARPALGVVSVGRTRMVAAGPRRPSH
jgi:urease accessory protein